MLKFAYGHKSHSSDVRVPSYGDLTETFPPRTVMVAMDGSEDSRFAFHWYVQNIHRPGDRVVIVFAVEFHSEHDSRWLFSFTESVEEKVGGSLDKERARHLETVKKFSKLLENSKSGDNKEQDQPCLAAQISDKQLWILDLVPRMCTAVTFVRPP
nr:uncharacterized protein LOC105323398 isoform X5 [Crassostrea gigas]